jgi:quercetin dioxygenase-like cupin family protein
MGRIMTYASGVQKAPLSLEALSSIAADRFPPCSAAFVAPALLDFAPPRVEHLLTPAEASSIMHPLAAVQHKEVVMRRTAIMLVLTLAVGLALGALGDRLLSAQQEPLKRTVLLKTDLAGIEGKEALLVLAEIAPGAASGKHYHPGDELVYVLEGSLILEQDGKAPVTLKAGDVAHTPAKLPHNGKNISPTAPVKIVIAYIVEKGQPLTTPVP